MKGRLRDGRWQRGQVWELSHSGLTLQRPGSSIPPKMRVKRAEHEAHGERRQLRPPWPQPTESTGFRCSHVSKLLVKRTRNRGHILLLSPSLPGASRNWLWLPDQGLTSVRMFLLLKRKKKRYTKYKDVYGRLVLKNGAPVFLFLKETFMIFLGQSFKQIQNTCSHFEPLLKGTMSRVK